MLFRAKISLTPWWWVEWAAYDTSALKVHIEYVIPCYCVTLNMLYNAIVLLCRLSTFHIPLIDCHIETISITSHTYHIIDFGKECPTRTVLNSAVWNINTTGEARGYWLYSNDIKNFLTFNTEGKLKVCCWTS